MKKKVRKLRGYSDSDTDDDEFDDGLVRVRKDNTILPFPEVRFLRYEGSREIGSLGETIRRD